MLFCTVIWGPKSNVEFVWVENPMIPSLYFALIFDFK